MRAPRPRKLREHRCGTSYGAKIHYMRGERPCPPCAEAARVAGRQWWARRSERLVRAGLSRGPKGRPACGSANAYKSHRRHGEEPCEACREAYRAYDRATRAARRARSAST